MPYPSAPWTLVGDAIQTLHLVNINCVRSLVPKELNIISLWPGKTLGGVYLARYKSNSVLQYSELIVVPAVVFYQGKIGAWISHIYVDNADSVAGGREIWGLPKELADFTWEGKNVTVRQGDTSGNLRSRLLCRFNYNQHSLAWRQHLSASAFSAMANNLLTFRAEFDSRLGLVGCNLEIPDASPFALINLTQPFATVYCEQMRLWVDAPQVVGQRIS